MKSEERFLKNGVPLKLKICLVGDAGIGKEAFIKHFLSKTFISKDKKTGLTIGVDFYSGKISIDTDKGIIDCRIHLWEFKGSQRYKFMYPSFLKGTNGILLFFDLANRESFLHLIDWIELIEEGTKKEKKQRKKQSKKEIPILLVGNRSDPEKSAIFPKEFDDFIRKYNLDYIETSTLTNEGIIDSFYSITSLIVGVGIQSEYFISRKTEYHPSISPPATTTSITTFSAQDIHDLTQRIVILEEKLDHINFKKEKDSIREKIKQSSSAGHQVFICYSNKDKDVADAVCHFLEHQGIKCWIAPRDVSTGPYASSIVEAIEKSKLMVLIFTNSANFSKHVKRELELAVSNGLTIQPIKTEDVEPTSELKYYISSMHWLEALTPPLEEHLSKLAKMVSKLLEVI